MRFPNIETVERVRREYPVGTRVRLLKIDDIQAPPVGTLGTVTGVDDIASIMVSWDSGGSLNVVYGEDIVEKVESIKIVCYGKEEIWDSRREAMNFYRKCMAMSEGSEHQRYEKIYEELTFGFNVCTDEDD